MLTPTATFNPAPRKLVTGPDATPSRSAFSADGAFVAYLTGVRDGSGARHVHAVAAGDGRTEPGGGTVVAARGATFAFTDRPSAPGVYPETADLKVWDAAGAESPRLVDTAAVGRGAFFVAPGGRAVLFVRASAPGGPNVDGAWAAPPP